MEETLADMFNNEDYYPTTPPRRVRKLRTPGAPRKPTNYDHTVSTLADMCQCNNNYYDAEEVINHDPDRFFPNDRPSDISNKIKIIAKELAKGYNRNDLIRVKGTGNRSKKWLYRIK